jgi:predicted permease
MVWAARLATFIRRIFHRREVEGDLDSEIAVHFELLAERYMAKGMSLEAARRAARVQFGAPEEVKQNVREVRVGVGIETAFQDIRYATRTLRRSPGFAAAAVLTIALGIGASTAIFSVANAVLLRPLPYRDAGRLVYACEDFKTRNVSDHLWSGPNYMDLRDRANSTLEEVAAVSTLRNTLPNDDGRPEEYVQAAVTPNIFRLLGVRIVAGRDFTDSDAQPEPATVDEAPAPADQRLPLIAIASEEFFQRRFGGNPAMLGKPIVKNGPILVGVLERGVELLFRPDKNIERRPDLWMVQRMQYTENARVGVYLRVIARLRPSVTLRQAQSQADAVAVQIRGINSLYRGAGLQIRLEPMQQYLVAPLRQAILALMGAVIFLLLIACSNVANLFLVRASLRVRDLAVRTAMGASWWRLARQLLAEAMLVSAMGSGLGFGLAWTGVHELLAIAPANLIRLDATRIDPAVLAFSICAGLASAVLFGLAPSLRAARPDVAQVLRASGRSGGLSGGAPIRNAVVVLEVALCFVLLVGSGLMFRSFLALQHIDMGFDPRGVLTFRAMGGRPGRTPEERAVEVRQMQAALAAIPGVESVTAANILPLGGLFFPNRWGKEEALSDPSKFQSADFQILLPGYFEAMKTRLFAGRFFNESDNNAQVRRVIVDQQFAAKAFPNGNAVGQRILVQLITPTNVWYEIVGVVAHQRLSSLAEPGREQLYAPDGALTHRAVEAWALRTKGDPGQYASIVREQMTKFDRSILLKDVQTMETIVAHVQTGARFSLFLIAGFAVIAASLAGVGLYGVLSTVVRQRTAEIGVRMALGAAPGGIFGLMIGYGLRLSAVGIMAGLMAALLLTRAMSSMLVGIMPTDPLTFAGMAALFFLIAALATWIPARRAAALNPSAALREE